jgi:hypothetical protein
VTGALEAQEVSYSLGELSDSFSSESGALKFRYFQIIEGELVLPEGFEPTGMSVVAKASTPRKLEITEQFPWQLQERFSNVGK